METLAAFLAVKCFVRDRKSITVLLRLDNTTAVAYVNSLGGTVSLRLNTIVRELCVLLVLYYYTIVQPLLKRIRMVRKQYVILTATGAVWLY